MRTLIRGGNIVNEGKCFVGSVLIEKDRIISVNEELRTKNEESFCSESMVRGGSSFFNHTSYKEDSSFEVVDARGCFVLPGIIDSHVHFRQPGLTDKADIESESRAAAYGGVTSYFDMPNTIPQTTILAAWEEKQELGKQHSHVNYSFFFGATGDNNDDFQRLDRHRLPGIKLFMGASTGNMQVGGRESLASVFGAAKSVELPLMAHCEDTPTIDRNMQVMKERYGDDPDIQFHSAIRSEEACVKSSLLALELAHEHGTRLHLAHVSTAKELDMLDDRVDSQITAEAVIAHLLFSDKDYQTKGGLIKCNPAVKTEHDREMLRQALTYGKIATIATDHAPHLLSHKLGGCAKAASGLPMIQFSLPVMLGLVDEGVLTIERLVELMAHNPARLFEVRDRGFMREGGKADITIVKPHNPWTVTEDIIQSKCRWSPLLGHTFNWKVTHTICNGHVVYRDGVFDDEYRGEEIAFR